jgi:hypothetical protein
MALLCCAWAACAGNQHPEPVNHGVCTLETSIGDTVAPTARSLPPQFWFTLLLRGYRASGTIARPAKDCSGFPVEWKAAESCSAGGIARLLEPQPLSAADLVVTAAGGGNRLVWAMTDRLSNGEAQGPVAIAEFQSWGVAVRKLGVLRGYRTRPRLRLERLEGGTLLVAEGETCEDETDAKTCSAGVRIVPLGIDRFTPKDLTDESGQCLGSAFFPLRSKGVVGAGAQQKKFQGEVSLTFHPKGIAVHEQLAIEEPGKDPDADGPGTFVRTAQADRQILLRQGRLVTTAPSLLDRWMKQQTERRE